MNITDLPYPHQFGLKHLKKHQLTETLTVDHWMVPKGTMVILTQSQNFAYVVLPAGTLDVRGFVIPRQVFAY